MASGEAPRPGRFITLEGIEGVGKSTNLEFVGDYLRQRGCRVVVTREPGGTPIGERIRELLLDPASSLPAMSELLLMFAARAAHLEQVVRPALASGQWVVCDRFTDATYAYQGGGRGVPAQKIEWLEQIVQGELRPDLTLLLDAAPQVARERQTGRGTPDRFEREAETFFARVRTAYLMRARQEPGRVRIIAAERPLAEVQADLVRALDQILEAD